MTRTTVYNGTPWNDRDENEVVYDAFHDHDVKKAVHIQTSGGQEIHFPSGEAVDIYIDGEEVDDY